MREEALIPVKVALKEAPIHLSQEKGVCTNLENRCVHVTDYWASVPVQVYYNII